MLESPVPIIMGLNESMNFVLNNEYEKQYSNFIFVFLDHNIILTQDDIAKNIGSSIPNFNNFRTRMRSIYETLNHTPSLNFPLSKKNKKNAFLYKTPIIPNSPNFPNNNINNNKKLNYSPTNKEMNACEEIFKFMKVVLEVNILNRIPQDAKFLENDRSVK